MNKTCPKHTSIGKCIKFFHNFSVEINRFQIPTQTYEVKLSSAEVNKFKRGRVY